MSVADPVARDTIVDRGRIEVVLFDLDDTLMAHTQAVDEAISRAQADARGAFTDDAVAAMAFANDDAASLQRRWRELEEVHYTRYLTGELTYLGQRIWRARDLLAPYGITVDDAEALAWFDRYLLGYRDAWRLFDDVLPALDALRVALPHVRFGIITNGDLAFQTDKLTRIGLWDRLDLTPVRVDPRVRERDAASLTSAAATSLAGAGALVPDDPARKGRVIASGELGITKPDVAIFHAAAAVFDVEPARCAYVGDRVRTDAVGAHDAGMLGIWLDRGSARNPVTDHAEGDAPAGVPSIPNLLALPALLA